MDIDDQSSIEGKVSPKPKLNENSEQPVIEAPETESEAVTPPVPVAPAFDPRRRIRELLSIPDRDRTDDEWDELNELEIQTAPGNRASGQPFGQPSHIGMKPAGAFQSKNRKNKGPRKPGLGRPPQGKPHNKPRPA